MLCKDLKEEIFEAALSGSAPGDKIKAHIASCVACEQEFESLRSTMDVLDTWSTPEPSPYFDVRLRARLREVKEQEQQQHGVFARWLQKIGIGGLSWKPLTAAAFTMIMAVAGGVYVAEVTHGGSGKPVVQAACPVVDLQALDQNQQVLSTLQDFDDDGNNSVPAQVNE